MPKKLVLLSDVRNSLLGFGLVLLLVIALDYWWGNEGAALLTEIITVVFGLGSLYADLEKKSHSARIF
jgi:hypothetical protein